MIGAALAILTGNAVIATPNGQFTNVLLDSPAQDISMPALEKALETARSFAKINAEASLKPEFYQRILDGTARVRVARDVDRKTEKKGGLRLEIYNLPGVCYVFASNETGRVFFFGDDSLSPFNLKLSTDQVRTEVNERNTRVDLMAKSKAFVDLLWPKEFKSEITLRQGSEVYDAVRIVGPYRTATTAQFQFGAFGELTSVYTNNSESVYDADARPSIDRKKADEKATSVMKGMQQISKAAKLQFQEVKFVIPVKAGAASPPVLAYCYAVFDSEYKGRFAPDGSFGWIQISAETGEPLAWNTMQSTLG